MVVKFQWIKTQLKKLVSSLWGKTNINPLDFEKPVRLWMGLLIGAVWPSWLTSVSNLKIKNLKIQFKKIQFKN